VYHAPNRWPLLYLRNCRNLNRKDREDREETFLGGLRGLCGSAVAALLNTYDFRTTEITACPFFLLLSGFGFAKIDNES
jgi:hypothetical protein